MKSSIERKLANINERYQEIAALLGDAEIIENQNRFRELSKEYAQIEPVAQCFQHYLNLTVNMSDAKALLLDPDMKDMAEEEIKNIQAEQTQLEKQLELLLIPHDPNDQCNTFLEIRAGTGGDEAAIFAGDLFRMYSRYAEIKGWRVEVLSHSDGEHGGYKEIISRILGKGVYSRLKFESGAHRVQRVPETESQGRVHTSACTVAVMPEVEEVEAIEINPVDLKVDTYRSSGAGGQHVNTTDSAIRITHLPTGIVVECQDERSQHKNRARAMSLLQARILEAERIKQQQEQAATRKSLVGTGDRSERIRTYNYPQGRITDHRINLTLYKLPEIMEGHMEPLIDVLIQEHQAEQLAAIAGED